MDILEGCDAVAGRRPHPGQQFQVGRVRQGHETGDFVCGREELEDDRGDDPERPFGTKEKVFRS